MGSPYSKLLNSPDIQDIKSKFSLDELETLSRIYTDLSARDYDVISKETFLQFFGLTGLWGERIFERFDTKHTENLGFAAFLKGLAAFCKCSEDEKIKLLFSLYDMDNDDYIKRKELLTMLYNFPKHYLKEIIDDVAADGGERMERFNEEIRRRTMTNIDEEGDPYRAESHNILASPFVIRNANPDIDAKSTADLSGLIVADENTEEVLDNILHRNLKNPRFNVSMKNNSGHEEQVGSLQQMADKTSGEPGLKLTLTQSTGTPLQKPQPLRNKGTSLEVPRIQQFGARKATALERKGSNSVNKIMEEGSAGSPFSRNRMSTIMLDQSYMVSTTFNVRVKEYASVMFRGCDGAQRSGKICFEEFKKWLNSHPILLKVFDGAFHQDLWMSGSPESRTSQSPITDSPRLRDSPLDNTPTRSVSKNGIMFKKGKKTGSWKQRYYELRGPFLSYYTNKEKTCLKGVLFLEGCSIAELSPIGNKHGFSINHKSESYQVHCLYCESKEKYDEWMSQLKFFNSTSINDFYQLQEEIGTGKFSIVYKAISQKDKKEYAIKAVQKDKLNASEKAAILSETSVMKMLDHPTTIKLFETIEIKNNLYIVMEIVKDGDLFDYVMTKDYLEEKESSFIMKQLLVSVNYLHNVGIIHRDLKPENIMISRNATDGKVKEVKLIDFGFAKFLSSNTLLKDACGTPNYVAPEVIKGNGYDKRSDVFSLGVIMYFLIRGLLPFDSTDVGQILMLTYKCEVPIFDEHWQNISPEAKDLLLKLLEKDPDQRIEIEEALNHPWIKNRDNLKKYDGVNRIAPEQNNDENAD